MFENGSGAGAGTPCVHQRLQVSLFVGVAERRQPYKVMTTGERKKKKGERKCDGGVN
jgi:hypothetical protein